MRLVPLPDEPRPLVFAHRGLSVREPENTMAAFRAARAAGIPGIELDVHLTRDGKLAVIHDDTTARTGRAARSAEEPGGVGIEETDWDALRGIDVGSWKDPERAGERIPLLGDLFGEFGRALYYDVELKTRSASGGALEAAVAEAMRAAGVVDRCTVSSFNPMALARFKALEPRVPTAIIWSRSKELYWYLRHGEGRWIGHVDYLKPEGTLVRRGQPAAAGGVEGAGLRSVLGLRGPRPVVAWTIDDPAEARRLLDLGVEGIVSNDPTMLGPAVTPPGRRPSTPLPRGPRA